MKKHLANFITCLNVLAGSVAIVFAFQGQYLNAALCIALAAVFDFLDGFAARLLKAVSPLGKELDSLCDVISFGLAPSVMAFHYMHTQSPLLAYVAFVMVAFSALRLAMFNLDERQSSSFIGLPTPANAIFWAFGLAGLQQICPDFFIPAWMVALLCLLCSWLLVSPLPMFSLKFKNLHIKDNALRFIFLGGCLILMVWLKYLGLSLCILWYVFLCLLSLIAKKS